MWDRHWVLGRSGRPAKEAEEEGPQDRRKTRTGETWSSGREGLQEKGGAAMPNALGNKGGASKGETRDWSI